MARRVATLVLGGALGMQGAMGFTADGTWVTQDDVDAVNKARAAMTEFCLDSELGSVDRVAGREAIDGILGGTNFVLDALKQSSSGDQAGQKIVESIQGSPLSLGAAGIALTVVMLIIYLLCCWTAFPCCACCRVCAARRKTSIMVKAVLIGVAVALSLGVIVSAGVALGGHSKAVAGFDTLGCTGATLVNGTLGGQETPYFIGMLPLLGVFHDIEQSLGPGAAFITSARSTIDSTASIGTSVRLAGETMNLLKTSLEDTSTKAKAEKHVCDFCDALSPVLEGVVTSLNTGVAATLDSARVAVNDQLNDDAARDLQKQIRDMAKPLTEMKKLVRDAFAPFTNIEEFTTIRGYLDDTARIPLILFLLDAFVVSTFAILAVVWFFMRETNGDIGVNDDQGNPYPRYSKVPNRSACCAWCCSWYLGMLIFLLAGIFGLISVVLASTCQVLDGLSVQMLRDIGPAISMDIDDPANAQVVDIIDQCVANTDPDANPALVDIIKVDNATGNSQVTIRQLLEGQVKGSIEPTFDAIDAQMGSNDAALAQTDSVVNMIKMMANPIDLMIVADPNGGWETNADYQDIFNVPALGWALYGSIRCPNGTVSAEVPVVGGKTIGGVQHFVTELGNFGTVVVASRADCADTVTCTTVNAAELAACTAGNRYVTLKRTLRDITTFKCDVFEDPSNPALECDPFNMVGTFNPATGVTDYTSSCLQSDGTVKVKAKTCNLADYVTYVQNFGTRINKTMTRIDTSVSEVGSGISTSLRGIVQVNLLAPLDVVINGVTCGFIGGFYRNVVDGLCFQGTVGLGVIASSWEACGAILIVLIAFMYGVWRRAIDNVQANVKVLKVSMAQG